MSGTCLYPVVSLSSFESGSLFYELTSLTDLEELLLSSFSVFDLLLGDSDDFQVPFMLD